LTAEREERTEIVFSPRLLANKTEPVIVEAIKGQRSIFTARRKALAGQVSILNQQSAQILEEIKGLQGQIISEKEQQRLIADEISDISSLVEMGLATRPRLRKLERESAEIDGRLSQNAARIAQAKQAIAETRLKASELKTAQANEVVQELRAVQSELFDLAERRRATEDVMARTTVRAPIAGTIVDLLVHTRGGVITPGAPLMDIVPSADLLVVEARVSPNDIDIVHIGLPAQVRFSAFSQRSTQPVDGIVTALSADSLTDENTGETYYLARVKIKDDLTEKLGGAELYPGMQAEVMIVTGERTALEYFFKPLTSSLNRAFREQ
jgi:HlyD family type I secretion membrane fusion protein